MRAHRSVPGSRAASARPQVITLVVVTLLALATILVAPAAQAQSYAKHLELSGFGGYNIASDIYRSTNGASTLELKNGFMWGGRVTAFSTNYTAVEFAYSRNQSDVAVRNGGSSLDSDFAAGTLAADEYDLNFLVSQPAGNPKLWPYFTLGFGWTVTHPDVATGGGEVPVNVKSNSLFAFNFGVGTLVEMNPKLGLRLDARWRVTDTAITTSSGVYCDYWGYCWSYSSDWYSSGELTAGLTYKIGN